MSKQNKFYQNGIRFECTGCGDCCRSHGEYAYVYLSTKDVDIISSYLKMNRLDFLNAYCKNDEYGNVHLSMTDGDCNFLKKKGRCRIYPVRPMQCKAWPFWTENLQEHIFKGAVAGYCKGVGKGRLWTEKEIDEIAKKRDDWYK
jgi:Fe-S-cluster containining protein